MPRGLEQAATGVAAAVAAAAALSWAWEALAAVKAAPAGGEMDHGAHGMGGMSMTFHVSYREPLFFDGLAPYDAASYVAVLVLVATVAAGKEWLLARRMGGAGSSSGVYGAHLGVANLVMLAVMSYNVGYVAAALGGSVAGHRAFVAGGGGAAKRAAGAAALEDPCC